MKKLKNNRGVTGIDIVISVLIIVMSVGLIGVMFSRYSKKSKEIERNTQAINLAMNVIEKMKLTDYDAIKKVIEDADANKENYVEIDSEFDASYNGVDGFDVKKFFSLNNIPNGYLVKISQEEIIQEIITILKLNIQVEYNIGKEIKSVTLGLNKVKDEILEEANPPDLTMTEVNQEIEGYTRYLLKYSNSKKGYIKAKQTDDDWYSISGKRFAIVAYAKETDFDVNGVIDLEKCNKIYVWVPKFGRSPLHYRFAKFNKKKNDERAIFFKKNGNEYGYLNEGGLSLSRNTYDIYGYVSTCAVTEYGFTSDIDGKWVLANAKLRPIDNDGNIIKNIDTDGDGNIEENEKNILNILNEENFWWKLSD